MDEHFHVDPRLDAGQMRAFSERRDMPGVLLSSLGPFAPWSKFAPFVKEEQRWRVGLESLLVLSVQGLCCGLLGWKWLVANLLGHAFLSLHLLTEHTGLPTEGSVVERTRSMRAPGWLRYFLWNMPWHAEHHAWPSVPFWQMPALHRAVEERLPEKHGYGEFYRERMQKILRGG